MVIASHQLSHNNKSQKTEKWKKLFFLCDKLAVVSEREIKITEKITVNEDGKNTE